MESCLTSAGALLDDVLGNSEEPPAPEEVIERLAA